MEIERKQKLLNYLMPNKEKRNFLCNDLFMELKELIPDSMIISMKNNSLKERKKNYQTVETIILSFINNNINYKKQIKDLFNLNETDILNDLVIGYVFFVINTNAKFYHIDIFKDKRSICYSPISIIDFI